MMTNSISRGELWLETLAPNAKRLEGLCPSVQAADGELNGETVRFCRRGAGRQQPLPARGARGSRPAGRMDAGKSGQRNRRR